MLRFPIPAVALLPHEPPMLCIDSLLLASANDGTASVCLTPDHILLHNGVLSRAGYVELAAQTTGAVKGYGEKSLGRPVRQGFLAAAQKFAFHDDAKAGELLRITVVQTAEVAGVSLIDAAIYRDHATREPELLAAGTLKVFVPENGQIVL